MNMIKIFLLFFIIINSALLLPQTSKIYYARFNDVNKEIYVTNLDGSNEAILLNTEIRPKCIAVDWNSSPKKIYVGLVPTSGFCKIVRYNIDGTNPTDVVTDLPNINDIELDLLNRKIYWLQNTYDDDKIMKADMDGLNSNIQVIYNTTVTNRDLWGLALSVPDQLLWITERGNTYYTSYIKRMTCNGGSLTTIMNPAYNPHDIEYFNSKLYLGDNDGVKRINTDGTGSTVLVSGAIVDGLAIDGANNRIYWTDNYYYNVKRCDLDGSNSQVISSTTALFSGIDTDFNPSALPVELISFSATTINSASTGSATVILNWQTATEVNNYGFEIERASPLPSPSKGEGGEAERGWQKIGFVQGYGNSNSQKTYTFTDVNPPAGKVQYRLKQIDNDGSFKYSDVIEVNIEAPATTELYQNYPNPFNPVTSIKFNLNKETNVKIIIYDILGNAVKELVNEVKPAGSYIVYWNSDDNEGKKVASGVYVYRLEAGDIIQIRKMNLVR